MKKKLILFAAGMGLVVGVNAQILYLPGAASGIGTSTSGTVGIGIQYAQDKLTVYDGNVRISPSINSANGFLGKYSFSPGAGYFVDPSAYIGGVFEGGAWYNGAALVFATNAGPDITNATSAVERMRINKYGNVGIGTTAPNNKLHLYSNSGPLAMTLQTGNSYAYFVNDGNNIVLASDQGATGFKLLVNRNAPDNSMFINSVGNIGIGTTSPAYKLDVSGSLGVRTITGATDQNLIISGYDNGQGSGQGLEFNAVSNGISFKTFENGGSWWKTRLFVHNGGIDVNGTVHAKEVKVDLTGWSDFVFAPAYKLKTLTEVEQYIKTNGHLPEIPSTQEVEQKGVNVGDMQAKLLQKVEELTLYSIEQEKKLTEQDKAKAKLEVKVEDQAKKNLELEQKLAEQAKEIEQLKQLIIQKLK